MKIKQHIPRQPVGQSRNQKKKKFKYGTSENGNPTYQNLWDATKVILRVYSKFIVINA